MGEWEPGGHEAKEGLDISKKLFEESQKLYEAYRGLGTLEIIRKRAEDVWNRIDQACVKIFSGEKFTAAEAEELIGESERIRRSIENKNY